jgi:dolichol-phosphate mannosyltransferase
MPRTGRNLSVARLFGPHVLEPLASLVHAGVTGRLPVARFSKFLVVGGLGVVVNTLLLALLYQLAHLPLLLASAIAVEASIIHNYLWNDRWTFARSSWALPRLVKFNMVSLAGLIITTGVLWTLVTYIHMAYLLANLVGIGIATVWNFAVNSRWTWGMSRGASSPPTQQ